MATDFDAIVVGSGPNGLSAAIELQSAGLSVLLLEAKSRIGGGMRTEELTLPGFHHDVCSAIHPMAAASPFFKSLPLDQVGVTFIRSPVALAHPVDDGPAAAVFSSFEQTAAGFGADAGLYRRLVGPLVRNLPDLLPQILGPFQQYRKLGVLSAFGMRALWPASWVAGRFHTERLKSLWGGLVLHGIVPFNFAGSAAIGCSLLMTAHGEGWPMIKGGSQSLADGLARLFIARGGVIETNHEVKSIKGLPAARAVVLDVGPTQLLQIAGERFPERYTHRLRGFRYGMGLFKVDWALDAPAPFRDENCRNAATVHLGGSFGEIALGESDAWYGRQNERPGVLFVQQSQFDPTRAPQGKHTAWAYCHVPLGSEKDMTAVIENQVERFAPGFRDRIIGKHITNSRQLEEYNPNYIGGDIGGGANTLSQLIARPLFQASPYRTAARGIYLCSASTPPAGGVHGMCGYHAARQVLRDLFPEQASAQGLKKNF